MSNNQFNNLYDYNDELFKAISINHYMIGKIDLLNDEVLILHSIDRSECIHKIYKWYDFFKPYLNMILENKNYDVFSLVSCEALLEKFNNGDKDFTYYFSYYKDNEIEWIKIIIDFVMDNERPIGYVRIRKSSQEYFLKSLVDTYIYDYCDNFYILDLINNRFRLYSGTLDKSQLPKTYYDNYDERIKIFGEKYIVEEDREEFLKYVNSEFIVNILEEKEYFVFHAGMMNPEKGYQRKRFEVRYFDKRNKKVLMTRVDITPIYKKELEKMKKLQDALNKAVTDPLTGLYNYQGLLEKVTYYLEHRNDLAALLFLDLDNFKIINDSLGHLSGDELLCEVAMIIKNLVGDKGCGGRVGGDEFVIYLDNVTSIDEMRLFADELCDRISHIQCDLPISASIGIAIAPHDGNDYMSLVKKADHNVYQSKADGKNKYTL